MAYNTVLQQGRFTADGNNVTLSIRSDVDWMQVYNLTQMAATNNVGVQYYWQRGFEENTTNGGISYFKSGGGNSLNGGIFNNMFTLVDTSGNPIGSQVATTASTNVAQPVISTGSTSGLVTGSIVRLSSMANVPNIMSMDFEIDTVVANTSFRMRWALANAVGAVGGAGFYRIVKFDPIYYPRRRFIVNISQAGSAVVTCSVTHGFTVGQEVRFQVPSAFGMVEIDNMAGTITAVNTAANTFTVNINSSAFTAFAFPAPGAVPFTYAQVVPVGEDTAQALSSSVNILADATVNEALIGMILTGGADNPGGDAADIMYWVAGKSFSVSNL